MKRLMFVGFLSVMYASAAPGAPPPYVPETPIAGKIGTAVRDCRQSDKWTVPVITWGADEVAIQANGGQHTTPNSVFASKHLDITLQRRDDFLQQVQAYMSCDSPFLRATLGMAAQVADLTEADPRTRMVAIYQHSWSAGGDVWVARENIRQPADLRGKTIVVQRYGPHVDYLLKVLADAGLTTADVAIRFTNDLTGVNVATPVAALRNDSTVDAVVVISPDAATLTSDGKGGTGADGSVKGAHILLSTAKANRIITDIYFVRRDFYDANKAKLTAFSQGLLEAETAVRAMAQAKGPDWNSLMHLSGKILLDDESNITDAAGMWGDAETTGKAGNLKFFTDQNEPRNFANVSREVQSELLNAGYISVNHMLAPADWDWKAVTGLSGTVVDLPKFDPAAMSRAVGNSYAHGTVNDDTLFSLDVHFKPSQMNFSAADYATEFARIVNLAKTYGGAVITVEGHADPLGYLDTLQAMENTPSAADTLTLRRKVQAGRNLSIQRAEAVRDAVMAAAAADGHPLDPSQFDVVGLGYDDPVTGMCGDRPCRPKNQQEWLSNMLVRFRVMNVQAEASGFH